MYEGPAQSNSVSSGGSSKNGEVSTTLGDSGYGLASDMEALNADATLASSYLLELASNNNLEGFQQAVEEGKTKLDVVGSWYCRQNGTSQMVVEQRTSIMVAALYGSVDVLMYILKSYASFGGDVNQKCGTDESSALHCAAGGGSVLAVVTVNLLLDNGANLNVLDAQGRRPADVIAKFPRHAHVKAELERVLKSVKPMQTMFLDVSEGLDSGVFAFTEDGEFGCNGVGLDAAGDGGVLQIAFSSASSLSVSPGGCCQSLVSSMSPSKSPKSFDTAAVKFLREAVEKVKEYPVDPSIPNVKNSMYTSDEFRMFSFKVRPCSRAYSHDWTECPFVHPSENARRRDPRRYHYSCVPCPDFCKGACSHGDACEYAHGVFECWLHPAQYRTRLCKDGTGCTRRVCFFAHTTEELRPLYVSTGSALPSPRTTTSLDMASKSPLLAPGSPSSVLLMSPFSPSNPAHQQGSLVTPPMSPSSPSANSLPSAWSQSNVPALHLPGVGLHSSRLRAALSARDIFSEDLERAPDFGRHSMSEFTALSSQVLSTQARLNAAVAASACGTTSSRAGKCRSLGLTVAPTNLEDLFASNMMSMVHDLALLSPIKSPMQLHKSSILQTQLHNEVQAQMQLQLHQAALDSQLQGSPLLCSPSQTPSFSLGRLSSLGGSDVDRQGSIGASKFPSAVAAQSEAFVQCNNRTQCLQDLGGGLSWSGWGSPTGKPEWGVHGDDLSKFRKLASFGFKKNDEPDFLRAQKFVKEGSPEANAAATVSSEDGSVSVPTKDPADHFVSGSWIENIHLDQIAAGSV